MTRFEILKRIEKEEQFTDLIIGLGNKHQTREKITEDLKSELSEKELQTLKNAAHNGYPLSFSGIQ